ncbi:MAG: preprotein translocase subunit SecG [Planctomycetaceae bacterium]|nr:preprotein translocase subunit SecG [Planctomycetaceae bacterium]
MFGYVMLLLVAFLSFLLIVIVLLQRGRGGGLAGALGGAGGQSAFGTKAGDVFTKITVGLALVWVLAAGISIRVLSSSQNLSYQGGENATPSLKTPPSEEEEGANDRPAMGEAEVFPGEGTAPEGTSTPAGTSESPVSSGTTPPVPILTPPAGTSSTAAPPQPAGTSTAEPAGTSS